MPILGLYAAGSFDVIVTRYAYAARDVMKLDISARAAAKDDIGQSVRLLVDKASTSVGVIVACEQGAVDRRAHSRTTRSAALGQKEPSPYAVFDGVGSEAAQ